MNRSGKIESAAHSPVNHTHKYVMVIDLAKCKNARKCVEQCQHAHHLLPNQELMKVYLMQESEEDIPYWMPKPCFHCDVPMCVEVCLTGATNKSEDGVVLIDKELCNECKECLRVCPYSSRQFKRDKEYYQPDGGENPVAIQSHETKSGINKCDFCVGLVKGGKLPHCVTACPNGTIYFGDQMTNTVSNGKDRIAFTELVSSRSGFRHREHLGTKPNVYYLPPDSLPMT